MLSSIPISELLLESVLQAGMAVECPLDSTEAVQIVESLVRRAVLQHSSLKCLSIVFCCCVSNMCNKQH